MGTKKDLCFLKEMLERLDDASGDITQIEYVKTMIKDWSNELERKIAKIKRSKR